MKYQTENGKIRRRRHPYKNEVSIKKPKPPRPRSKTKKCCVCNNWLNKDDDYDENGKRIECDFCDGYLCNNCYDSIDISVGRFDCGIPACKNCKKGNLYDKIRCNDCGVRGKIREKVRLCDGCDYMYCYNCMVQCSDNDNCYYSKRGNYMAVICKKNCSKSCKHCGKQFCGECFPRKDQVCYFCEKSQ